MDKELFKNPSVKYRAKPFWALNGKLEKSELERQIDYFKSMGFGGVFLHSRTGLETEYMSAEWMDRMVDCVNKLEALGMEAYLYDEDRWPSGTCGGKVTENAEYRAKNIVFSDVTDCLSDGDFDDCIGIFDCEIIDGNNLLSYKKLNKGNQPKNRALKFYVKPMSVGDPFYNGFCYVDTLNKDATDLFIELTHEEYKKRLGAKFGKSVVGIFTDEPNRGAAFNGFGFDGEDRESRIPYTKLLFKRFKERWGDELADCLPELYFKNNGNQFNQISYRYVETLMDMFIENFAKPYSQWCKNNGLKFTGHILHEDNLAAITSLCGSMMRFYEQMDIPGMDNLTVNNVCLPVPKMVSSVARQCGNGEALSELYAGIGWQATFENYKTVADWQVILGITLRCPHLSWYTMGGAAKRDYPASISGQSVWSKDYYYVEDYLSRLNAFINCGEKNTELAVIHPVESAWGLSHYGAYKNCFMETEESFLKLEKRYFDVNDTLVKSGIPFDYIDEEMLSRIASVAGGTLKVGKCVYRSVLLSGELTIRKSTLELLEKLIASGGRVVIGGELPKYLDGKSCDFSNRLKGAVVLPESSVEIADYLREKLDIPFCIYNQKGENERNFVSAFTCCGEEMHIAMVNLSEETKDVEIVIKGRHKVTVCDARKGEIHSVNTQNRGENTVMHKQFASKEELLLLVESGQGATAVEKTICEEIDIPEQFDYRLQEDNVLVLDYACFSVDGAEYSKPEEIIRFDRSLRQKLGMKLRDGNMYQPWFVKKHNLSSGKSVKLSMRFKFINQTRLDNVRLVGEQMNECSFKLNGKSIDGAPTREPLDISVYSLKIPDGFFTQGENVLEITRVFDDFTNLENFYLLGGFGVKAAKVCTLYDLPTQLTVGSVINQGLPFYGGEIKYKIPCAAGSYRVELDKIGGALAKLYGDSTEVIAFSPYVAECRTQKDLTIGITLTQKNTFGPLHKSPTLPSIGEPNEFMTEGRDYDENYRLIEQGLSKNIKLSKMIKAQ